MRDRATADEGPVGAVRPRWVGLPVGAGCGVRRAVRSPGTTVVPGSSNGGRPQEAGRMSDEDTGMAGAGSISRYVDGTYGTAVSSMSAHDRAGQLMHAVNQTLQVEGVPAVEWAFGAPDGTYGMFDASQWTMYLNEHYFSPEGTDA